MSGRRQTLAVVLSLLCLAAWGIGRVGLARGDDGAGRKPDAPADRAERRADRGPITWKTAVEPKPLSPSVKMGLDWLVEHQLPDGGWTEGEQLPEMGAGFPGAAFLDPENVTDTSIASLALIRSGSTPSEGPYRVAIVKGVEYVRTQVEASDAESPSISPERWTRSKMKIGPNIDTYMASMLLAEVKGRMPDQASERAVGAALDRVIVKMERHLARDGAIEAQGWAPVLSLAMSAKGLNRAKQAGARVSDVALVRMENAAMTAYTMGGWPAIDDSAGRTMAMRHPHAAHRAARQPRTTDGAGPADEGSRRSLAREIPSEETGRRSMLAAASPSPSSPTAGKTAQAGENTGRRSLLGGGSPAPAPPAVERGDDAGRRSRLADAGSSPPSSAGATKDRENDDLRTEPLAGHPASPAHPHRRRVAIGAAGVGRAGMRDIAAGIPLYGWSACLGILQDSLNTGKAQVPRLRELAAHSHDPGERDAARKKLARIAEVANAQQGAQTAVVASLSAPRFVAGLGSNGGEEFLSYMNLAESLATQGGETWERWDSGMTESLGRTQNADGSWSGSHCITGRTFCTSAALLTLMADRAPVPAPTSSAHPR